MKVNQIVLKSLPTDGLLVAAGKKIVTHRRTNWAQLDWVIKINTTRGWETGEMGEEGQKVQTYS